MNSISIKEKLTNLISDVFSDRGFDNEIVDYLDLIEDCGLDSLTFISLIVEIESVFDITIPDDIILMENFRTIDKVVNIIEKILKR